MSYRWLYRTGWCWVPLLLVVLAQGCKLKVIELDPEWQGDAARTENQEPTTEVPERPERPMERPEDTQEQRPEDTQERPPESTRPERPASCPSATQTELTQSRSLTPQGQVLLHGTLAESNARVYVEHPAGWRLTPSQIYTDASGRFGFLVDRTNTGGQDEAIQVYTDGGLCVSLDAQLTSGALSGKAPTPPSQPSCQVGDTITATAEVGGNEQSTMTAIATHPQLASLQQLTRRFASSTTYYDFRITCHRAGTALFLLGSSKRPAISFAVQVR